MMLRAIFIMLMFSSIQLFAQEETNYTPTKHQVSLSYYGEFVTHPGFRIGYLTPISQKTKVKNETNVVDKSWVVGGYFTYYKHKMNHDGLLFTGEIGRQRISKSGFISSINFEMGYMLAVLDGEVYTPTENGFEKGAKADSYFTFGLNLGLGWDFEKKMNLPISAMVVPHFYFQAPYNTAVTARTALEVKFLYHLR
ncbi:hypothetical protein [Flammeovirga agarivorans]|uniref:Outer membrane protein beta-barrel domain-containing protein n=1 Tax=Flammeovirga agarivorans TaxID=2726742 RepID=A0A7X8SK79_9BACT|nr:hypothetical protein [Flammeovirga agarivorans]NLR91662.1 hypothetical protein [Flammeovirga agarivorans]